MTPSASIAKMSVSPRIFQKAKRPKLGWSGLPKQMSCSSASTIRFAADGEDVVIGPGGVKNVGRGGDNKEGSASTNHLDRLKTAVANTTPLLRSRQSSTSSGKHKFSNLFPCPMVKTLDLDSPEGSLSSLGIVSGLNPHYVGPFASSTGPNLRRRSSRSGGGGNVGGRGYYYGAAAARMRAQREAYNRARSLQSQQPSVDVPIFITDDDDNVMSAAPGSGPGDVQVRPIHHYNK